MQWVKKLSEAILLQAIEDLYSKQHRTDALKFFNGEDFDICASFIGLTNKESQKIFNIVKESRVIKQFIPAVATRSGAAQSKQNVKHIPVTEVTHGVPPRPHRNLRREPVYHPKI